MTKNPQIETVNPLFLKTGGNKRGGQAILTSALGNKSVELIRLVSGSPDTPSPITIQLDANSRDPTGLVQSAKVVADIRWGWESGEANATVDVERGTTLTVYGSYVQVAVRFASDSALNSDTFVSATAAPGAAPRAPNTGPTLTLSQVTPPSAPLAAAGGTVRFAVPDFAKSVRITRVPETAGPVEVRCLNFLQTLIDTSVPGGATPPEILIPNGTDQVVVTNLDPAVALTAVNAVFSLAL